MTPKIPSHSTVKIGSLLKNTTPKAKGATLTHNSLAQAEGLGAKDGFQVVHHLLIFEGLRPLEMRHKDGL